MATTVPLDVAPVTATAALPDKGNAIWMHLDNTTLLEYLGEHIAEAGDGVNFKLTTFRGAAIAVNAVRTQGGPKTDKSCLAKYGALKKLNSFVQEIMKVSGWSWDTLKGVNVSPATQGSWDGFVAQFPAAARFKKAGWPYYDLFLPLVPVKAKGNHAFRPALAVAAHGGGSGRNKSPSPDWNQDEMDNDFSRGDLGNDDGGVGGGAGDEDEDESRPDQDTDTPLPSSPVPPVGTKRAAAQPTSGNQRKKARVSGGAQALQDIATAATDFNDIMGDFRQILSAPAQAPADASTPAAAPAVAAPAFHMTPQRRTSAIKAAQAEQWLLPLDRVAFINHISSNMVKVDTYNALETDEIRVPWVLDELRSIGIIAFHPLYSDFSLE